MSFELFSSMRPAQSIQSPVVRETSLRRHYVYIKYATMPVKDCLVHPYYVSIRRRLNNCESIMLHCHPRLHSCLKMLDRYMTERCSRIELLIFFGKSGRYGECPTDWAKIIPNPTGYLPKAQLASNLLTFSKTGTDERRPADSCDYNSKRVQRNRTA
jgi:hypothetical protein